jgi:glycosyltransferase involved in cell wall biosynthesis
MQFRLLWRPWGNSEVRVRQMIAERNLHNVELVIGCSENMAVQYRAAHVCAAPFTDLGRSKPAPNSVVEGLACGRPALVTQEVGLAELIQEGQAGAVCQATGEAIAAQLDRLQTEWEFYSKAARRLAERWFGADRFVEGYRNLYAEALSK